MKDLVLEFIGSGVFVWVVKIYIFALIFYIIYSAINYFKYHSKMKKTLLSVYNQMSEQEKNRAMNSKHERDIHGTNSTKDWLAKIDEELAYSGIKQKIRWLTTELYLLIVILTTTLVITIISVFTNIIYGLFGGVIVITTFKLVVSLLANSRDKKTEEIMLQFMNIVDNFSKTSDDLINILEKSSRYIDEPLNNQIYDAVIEARNTGDSLTALQQLQDKVKNKHFKVLIRNLEISSRFETNYSDIIEDCRGIFHEYIKSEKEKRSMRLNGIMEIATMLLCGVFCIYLLGDVTGSGNIVIMLLEGGVLGKLILGYVFVSVAVAFYIAIFKLLRK